MPRATGQTAGSGEVIGLAETLGVRDISARENVSRQPASHAACKIHHADNFQ